MPNEILKLRSGAYKSLFLGGGSKPPLFYLKLWEKISGLFGGTYKAPDRPGDKFNEPARAVLADLKRFCYAEESTFDPDTDTQLHKEGRREVFLRIMTLIQINFEDLEDAYEPNQPTEEF